MSKNIIFYIKGGTMKKFFLTLTILFLFLLGQFTVSPVYSQDNSTGTLIDTVTVDNNSSEEELIYEGEDFSEPEMALIKGGTIETEPYSISVEDFYIGKYEVTNKEYSEYDPEHENPGDDLPVVNVSKSDALAYCKWLSDKTGRVYRLPTSDEWEYAYRAGSLTDYYWGENMNPDTYTCSGIDDYAWYMDNSDLQVHPVGQKKPNDWGLYDMAGNVFEWCNDWYDNADHIIICGGSWDCGAEYCRADRYCTSDTESCPVIGFRVVIIP